MYWMDVDRARALAREHLAESLPRRWAHVRAVAAAATRLAADLEPADQSLLITAAWLHDIGYSPALCRTGFHPLDGARFLRSGGADSRLCGLVAHHTAARVEAGLRGFRVEMDTEFRQEQSQVADLLWLADLTTGPGGELVTVEERLDEIARRYGPWHVVTSAAALATPELLAAAARARGRIVSAVGQSTCAEEALAIP
jgi:hypothetical protein